MNRIKNDIKRDNARLEIFREMSLAENLNLMMLRPAAMHQVKITLQHFLNKYKGTPRELEAREAIKQWRTRNGV